MVCAEANSAIRPHNGAQAASSVNTFFMFPYFVRNMQSKADLVFRVLGQDLLLHLCMSKTHLLGKHLQLVAYGIANISE